MASQKGLDVLIKLGNGASPEAFVTLGGLRTKSITMNKEQVDVTSADNVDRYRELLAGASVRSFSISGSGVAVDVQVMKDAFEASVDDVFQNWQVIIPGIGVLEGPFQSILSFSGDHNVELSYDLTLESADTIEFAPET